MSRALFISILVLGFAAGVGCNGGKHLTSVHRQKPGLDKKGLRAKIKAAGEEAEKNKSEKTAALIKLSGPECLNMDAVSKAIQAGQDRSKTIEDKYTVYTRDADVGTLEINDDNDMACYAFTGLNDKVIRGQHALRGLHPEITQTYASKLDESLAGSLLKFTAQDKCERAEFLDKVEVYKVACKTPSTITFILGEKNNPKEIRNYQLGDKEIVITQYEATQSNTSCADGTPQPVYTRKVTVIAWDWLERVELRTAYAKLLNSYITPKQADLSAAIANAAPAVSENPEPDKKRPASSDTLTLSTGTYSVLLKEGKVEFPECKYPAPVH